jgi:hypothetical protein
LYFSEVQTFVESVVSQRLELIAVLDGDRRSFAAE